MKKKPLTNKSGHVRELTSKDIRAMKPANEVLPEKLLGMLPKRKQGERGPQKNPKKILLTQRLSSEVVHYFRATGQGWQTRIDNALKAFIEENPTYPKGHNIRKSQEQHKHHKHTKHQKHSRNVA